MLNIDPKQPDPSASTQAALPATLALEDVEAIVRMLNLAISDDLSPAMRRRAIVEGVARLVDADTWIWIRYRVHDANDPRPVPFDIIDGGYRDEAERGRYITGSSDETISARINRQMLAPTHRTNVLHKMLPPTPENAAIIQRYETLTGFGDFIVSAYPLGGLIWSGIALNRRAGRPIYTPRELAIVHVVIGQLDFLHREGTDMPANSESLLTLSARERQVLIFLLGGDSAKEIATKMGLSHHTVNDHIRAVYRRLNVRTRPELMKLFMSGSVASSTPDAEQDPTNTD